MHLCYFARKMHNLLFSCFLTLPFGFASFCNFIECEWKVWDNKCNPGTELLQLMPLSKPGLSKGSLQDTYPGEKSLLGAPFILKFGDQDVRKRSSVYKRVCCGHSKAKFLGGDWFQGDWRESGQMLCKSHASNHSWAQICWINHSQQLTETPYEVG